MKVRITFRPRERVNVARPSILRQGIDIGTMLRPSDRSRVAKAAILCVAVVVRLVAVKTYAHDTISSAVYPFSLSALT